MYKYEDIETKVEWNQIESCNLLTAKFLEDNKFKMRQPVPAVFLYFWLSVA